ncbi:hypothetical protein EDC39_10835 [Geothermobacter ehrlichii]|uniref:Uncharacterized protein n=1 Tax=Geothermobacter ehrlichii TaxID=213224 RepID=A0A5D3WIN4_9BACT|nr:DUF444 family protein [Geothermobacter ehrlichii]TYO98098.1 hypothetical protein EDC39_10835 [Geothermobacter ehrlichii]
MKQKLWQRYHQLKRAGLTAEQERMILRELRHEGHHDLPAPPGQTVPIVDSLYAWNDLAALQALTRPAGSYAARIHTLDELLERDRQREEDGFPRKIRVGRMVRPGRGREDKVVVVPTTVEEKFLHDMSAGPPTESTSGGSGDGEEGELVGEQPVRQQGESGSGQAGQGGGGAHELESNAYDLGKILTEKFELPNLKDKGKKRSLTRYTYDLTDRNRGSGQVLDKKATLRRILETNIGLGRLPDFDEIDTSEFIIAPRDRIYRVLSQEKDYESQAMVFFVRDYSGSMGGKATEVVCTQHVLIYSWLLYQYQRQVETRFILHDTEAREVEDFYTYYNSKVAGGTEVASAYRLVNEIVERESLERDYNIYVFHGTDGDDWDTTGKKTIPELKRMLRYASRVGITIAEHAYTEAGNTEVDKYLHKSGLLKDAKNLLRKDTLSENSDEARIIEGIKKLISE